MYRQDEHIVQRIRIHNLLGAEITHLNARFLNNLYIIDPWSIINSTIQGIPRSVWGP